MESTLNLPISCLNNRDHRKFSESILRKIKRLHTRISDSPHSPLGTPICDPSLFRRQTIDGHLAIIRTECHFYDSSQLRTAYCMPHEYRHVRPFVSGRRNDQPVYTSFPCFHTQLVAKRIVTFVHQIGPVASLGTQVLLQSLESAAKTLEICLAICLRLPCIAFSEPVRHFRLRSLYAERTVEYRESSVREPRPNPKFGSRTKRAVEKLFNRILRYSSRQQIHQFFSGHRVHIQFGKKLVVVCRDPRQPKYDPAVLFAWNFIEH